MQPLQINLRFGKIIQLLFLVLVGLASLIFLNNPHDARAAATVSVCDEATLTTALSGGGTVLFDCDGTITLTNSSINGLAIITTTTLDANGHNVTISGNDNRRIFNATGSNTVFTLNGLTLTHGNSVANMGGAIIRSSAGSLIISNTLFASTTYSSTFGNIYGSVISLAAGHANIYHSQFDHNLNMYGYGTISTFSGVQLTVTNSTFTHNGAVWAGAIFNYAGSTTVADSQFLHNYAIAGGAIYTAGGSFTTTNSLFDTNTAGGGGAVDVSTSSGAINFFNDQFNANSSTDPASGGGAFYIESTTGSTTVSNTTFTGNTSANVGGALVLSTGKFNLVNSSVVSSTAPGGGAFFTDSGTLTVANSTIANNSATSSDSPGGVLQANGTNTVNFINSTLTGNTTQASSGGSVLFLNSNNTTVLTNTIIANNGASANTSTCLNSGGSLVDGGNNLQFNPNNPNDCVGTVADPQLGPLQNNGGPTLTQALASTSPAIDAGNNSVCAAPPINNLDQRGVTRPQGSTCDIGAYEYGGTPVVVYSISANAGDGQSTQINTSFASPLSAKVTGSGNLPAAGIVVTFTLPSSGASATFVGGSTVYTGTTDASGLVTTTVLTANATVGSYSAVATATGVTNSASFSLTNTPVPATTYIITTFAGDGQSTPLNTAFAAPLVAKVTSNNNQPGAGMVVTFTLPSSGASATFAGGSTVYTGTTDASGLVTTTALTANATAGSYAVIATGDGVTNSAAFNLTNSATAYTIAADAGGDQSTQISTTFAAPLVAEVTDSNNQPGANVVVTFTLPSSGPSATFVGGSTSYTGTTDASGLVTTTALTANAVTGSYAVVATGDGITNSAAFNLTNSAAPVTYTIAANSGSGQSTPISTTFAAPLVAKVTDNNSQPAASIVVTFTAPSTGASATFAGGSTTYIGTTDASGLVTTTALTANVITGTYSVTATADGVTGSASFSLTNSPQTGCISLVVTQISDDGTGTTCGSFSYALAQSVGTASTPVTITFALSSGNTITFTGALSQTVKQHVVIDGSSNMVIGNNIVVLNGNGVASAGLRLEGKDTLKNLTVEHFGGTQIITLGPGNRLMRVRAIK